MEGAKSMKGTRATKQDLERHEINQAAQAEYRTLWDVDGDLEQQLTQLAAKYPDTIFEAFRDDGNHRQRRGFDFVFGRKRDGRRKGGDLGKVRVIADEPLEHRVIDLAELPHEDVQALDRDIFCQFVGDYVAIAHETLLEHVHGPSWAVLERGENGGNHLHLLSGQGACSLGTGCGTVPDNRLLGLAIYLGKLPYWTPENALGYFTVRRAYPEKPGVATRHLAQGVGSQRSDSVTIADITRLVGSDPTEYTGLLEAPAEKKILVLRPDLERNLLKVS